MIQEQLESGERVGLFDIEFMSNIHYFFVCPKERPGNERVKCFHDWPLEITMAGGK